MNEALETIARGARRFLARLARPDLARPAPLRLHAVRSLAEFQRDYPRWPSLLGPGTQSVSPGDDPRSFTVPGYCHVDARGVAFQMDDLYSGMSEGKLAYNWRERMVCPHCRLNNRMRGSLHVLDQVCKPTPASQFWITERVTPLYSELARRFPRTVGSEFLGNDKAPGWISPQGIRHETMASPSFEDSVLDAVLSFDVLEHVPELEPCLRQTARVLRPGGTFLFTAPFIYVEHATRVRARIRPDGTIEHLLPPQYHGDPVDPQGGVLCYREFGWDLIDALKAAGFADPHALLYYSTEYGYPGEVQVLFVARKGA